MDASLTHLKLLLDNSFDAILWFGLEKRYIYVSPAFHKLSGYTPEDLIADPGLFAHMIHPDDQHLFRNHLASFEAPAHEVLDFRIIDKSGETRWVAHYCQPLFDAAGKFLGRVSYNRNIDKRKTTELQLKRAFAQVERFRIALDNISAFVFIKDCEFRFAYGNKFVQDFFRCSARELVGKPDVELFPPPIIKQLRELDRRTLAGDDIVGEVAFDFPDGSKRIFSVVQSPVFQGSERKVVVGITGIATDVSETRQLQDRLLENLAYQRQINKKLEDLQGQLMQSEKLASIGQLAAGVAHEINNPIGFINSNFGTLEKYLHDLFAIADAYAAVEANTPDCPQLEQIHAIKRDKDYDYLRTDIFQLMTESKDGLSRVTKIVQDLKNFSHVNATEWQWMNVHHGIDSTLNIVNNELKYRCAVKKDYGDLPPVWCDPSQLNQVFMNLLVNAGQAIPQAGEITVRTGRQDKEVFIAITDTGEGIPPELLKRIFDPFFTTKPVGKGTGLGLSLVYGVVNKHQGRIEVQSVVGQGTTFTIWLPIEPDVQPDAVPINPAAPADAVPPAPTLEKP